jgi:hypothetical protein
MTDITTRGDYQNNISELPNLDEYDFENIFKMCYDPDTQAYFYNILKTVNIPVRIEKELFTTYRIPAMQPLTALSHSLYGTMKLWWLICITNQISNPVNYLEPGRVIKVIVPRHVPYICGLIKRSLVD